VEVARSSIVNDATPLASNRSPVPFGSFHIEIDTTTGSYKMGVELKSHGKSVARRKFE